MKKILHFHPNAFYAQKFIKPLNYAELEAGYSTKLITSKNTGSSDQIFNFAISFNPIILFLRFLKLLIFLKQNKPEIIFAHNSTSAFLPLLVSKLLFVRNIIYFNHGLPFLGHSGILKFLLLTLEKLNFIFADIIITVSDDMKKNISYLTKKKYL